MDPTIDLTMIQPAGGGPDPLAGLLVTLAWIWLIGVPWLRFCWWLGHRPRRTTDGFNLGALVTGLDSRPTAAAAA